MNCPPESIWLIAFEIDGFSATQRTRMERTERRNVERGNAVLNHVKDRLLREDDRVTFGYVSQQRLKFLTSSRSAMAVDLHDHNSVTTSLLTLLNVSAIKPGKRKRPEPEFVPAEKLNKRKTVRIVDTESLTVPVASSAPITPAVEEPEEEKSLEDNLDANSKGISLCIQFRLDPFTTRACQTFMNANSA